MVMNNFQVAPCSSFKRRCEHLPVALVTALTTMDGGNAGFAWSKNLPCCQHA